MEQSLTHRLRMESSGVDAATTREGLDSLSLDFEVRAITGLFVYDYVYERFRVEVSVGLSLRLSRWNDPQFDAEKSIGRRGDSCASKSNSPVGTQAAASRNGPRAWGPTVFSDPYFVSNIFETLVPRNPFLKSKRRKFIAVNYDYLLTSVDFNKK